MNRLLGIAWSFPLICSVPLVAATPEAAAQCEARSLDFGDKAVGWAHQPLSRLKRDTKYALATQDGRTVLSAAASGSASIYVVRFAQPADARAELSWRWKTDALVPGADNRDKKREDAPLRVIVGFDGDRTSLPEAEQKRFKRAKALSGREPPFATHHVHLERPRSAGNRDSFGPLQPVEDAGGRVRARTDWGAGSWCAAAWRPTTGSPMAPSRGGCSAWR